MKKFISMVLCVIMLVGAFCMVTSGASATLGAATSGVNELQLLNALPVDPTVVNISQGLTTSPAFSEYSHMLEALTQEQRYDLSRHLTYGFSIIGVSSLGRPLSAAIDGYWNSGNTGESLTNKNKQHGALDYYPENVKYNVKGETGKNDSIYTTMMTFNFGKVAKLNSMGFAMANGTNINGFPQGADIYISNDGENWTLIGYYDRVGKRMDGSDMTVELKTDVLGNDATGETKANYFALFDLNDVEAQFLRIATLYGAGKTNPADPQNAETYHNAYGDTNSNGVREIIVLGTMTNKTNNITATEKAPAATTAATTAGNNSGNSSLIPVKTAAATTVAATTAEATVATTAATTAAEEGGCGSMIGVSAVAMMAMVVGTTVLVTNKKKRR